jgi:hypothetical protein
MLDFDKDSSVLAEAEDLRSQLGSPAHMSLDFNEVMMSELMALQAHREVMLGQTGAESREEELVRRAAEEQKRQAEIFDLLKDAHLPPLSPPPEGERELRSPEPEQEPVIIKKKKDDEDELLQNQCDPRVVFGLVPEVVAVAAPEAAAAIQSAGNVIDANVDPLSDAVQLPGCAPVLIFRTAVAPMVVSIALMRALRTASLSCIAILWPSYYAG